MLYVCLHEVNSEVIVHTMSWKKVPVPDKLHEIEVGVLATDGYASFTGELHLCKGMEPFMTRVGGQFIMGFTPTHYTKDHIPSLT